MTAAALTSPAAAARTVTTVRSDAAGALLDHLPAEGALSWVRRGDGLVGRGEAARLEVTGPHALTEAADWWASYTDGLAVDEDLGIPGSGPVVFASIAFDPVAGTSVFVVPEVTVGRRDGVGWITTIGDVDPRRPARARTGRTDDGAAPAPLRRRRPGPGHLVRRRRHRGRADRRRGTGQGRPGPRPAGLRRRARSTRAGCCGGWPTASPTAGRSPSTACSAPPPSCCCGAPAGSCRPASSPAPPRGAPAADDQRLADALIGSAKDRAEHALAVDSLVRALEPYCTTLDAPAEPELLTLANVRHLASDITGTQRSARPARPRPGCWS